MHACKTSLALLGVLALGLAPAYAQFPGKGDDTTTSLGSFKISVAPAYQSVFDGCSGYDSTTHKWKSPTLYDPATVIGRSAVIKDGDSSDTGGVAVGSANTSVSETMLLPPADYPCANGNIVGCTSGATTREVHTEVRSLKMTSGQMAVRAGVWYDNASTKTDPPSKISPGEVESQSGPGGDPANDFPASSFFNIYVQVDVPQCGGLSSAVTLFNDTALLVKNYNLTVFPPKVVYLHDASSSVPIKILNSDGTAGDTIGSIELAGHGVGFTNSDDDTRAFENYMTCLDNSSVSPTGPSLSCDVLLTSSSGSTNAASTNIKSTSPAATQRPAAKKP